MSAEYILSCGNRRVMLCERGIRTFENSTRNTTDINAIPVLKSLTHLPVLLDLLLDEGVDYAKGDRLAWPGAIWTMPPLRLLGTLVLAVGLSLAAYLAVSVTSSQALLVAEDVFGHRYEVDLFDNSGEGSSSTGDDTANVPSNASRLKGRYRPLNPPARRRTARRDPAARTRHTGQGRPRLR